MDFTPHQLEILKLVAQGYIDSEIAEQLRLRQSTVTLTLRRLMRQLDATSLADFRRKAGAIDESPLRVTAAPNLTEREAHILHLLALGRTNQQIGDRLHLATGSVRNQLVQIYRKLGVRTRAKAAVRAIELGLNSRMGQSR